MPSTVPEQSSQSRVRNQTTTTKPDYFQAQPITSGCAWKSPCWEISDEEESMFSPPFVFMYGTNEKMFNSG